LAEEACEVPTTNGRGLVREHLVDLYGNACVGCESSRKRQVILQSLSEHKDVFSSSDYDMGLTKAVCHEIPRAAGTGSNWQLTG